MKRDLYIQIVRETFPFIFPAEILFLTQFHASRENSPGNAAHFAQLRLFKILQLFCHSREKKQKQRGEFADIIS